ncbi:MAG TPA: hypothetical protein VKB56_02990 [Terriglobales bacterium]|nr:hypothetical protein [Terriglobales bacterium]
MTSIAGTLPSWSQVTLDGINIQDIFIRTNALDFIPNRPTTESVEEFTISQGAQDADAALGANGVRMVTKSGTNAFHGTAYEFNRNSAYAANTWFNNHSNVPIPFLNRNEYGVNFGGPIKKNKLFIFGAYDASRIHQGSPLNQTIPAHDDYLQGVFRYIRPSDGTVQAVNILSALPGITIDPKIQSAFISKIASASNVNNFNKGDSTGTALLNTAGFTRNQAANDDRDNWVGRVDYDLSARHHFDFVGQHVHETTLRNDIDPIDLTPKVFNNSVSRLFVGSWRWSAKDTLVNTVRIGSNYSIAPFDSSFVNTDGFLFNSGTSSTSTVTGAGITGPQVFFQPQGRIPTVHQYMDDATWVRGSHSITFGGQFQKQNVDSYDYGINPYLIPIMVTGFGPAAPANVQLTAANFPGSSISSADLSKANNLRAFLGGIIQQINQQFYVTSQTSGFVPGARNDRNLTLNDIMGYGEDKWRIRPNLTLNYGVKWEYLSPYKEINGLQLSPVWQDPNNPVATLLNPNTTINFNNSLYHTDWNNFGPVVGVAWDPFKDGKTVVRAGYTITYVNDDTFRSAGNASDGNAGLGSSVNDTGLYAPLSNAPTVPTPTFKMPRTLADQIAVGNTSALFGIDPNIKIPMVHEISVGVQRELTHNLSVEARYVGTLGHSLVRGIDYNQTNAGANQAYLTDFVNARTNGFLAAAQPGGKFVPTFNPAIPGSQPTPYFNALGPSGGLFSNSTVVTDLQQNQAAALADFYVANRGSFPNAPAAFLPNPAIYAADLACNCSWSSYHSGVVEVRKRYSNGMQLQSSYTWSKALTDSPSDTGQTRFDAFLDNNRKSLEKAPSSFDLRQQWKLNALYDLPFGRGKMLFTGANGLLDRIIGGWQLSGVWSLQSGAPFSILSNRGTFNRGGRSTFQSAVSTLSQSQIQALMNRSMLSNGNVYWINPAVTGSDGRAVGQDTLSEAASTAFSQVFFNPGAGQVGNLGLNAFTGPAFMGLNMGLSKTTKITERVGLQLRADAFNLPNHPVFAIGDQEINSTTFGRITSTNISPRQLQFGARLTF